MVKAQNFLHPRIPAPLTAVTTMSFYGPPWLTSLPPPSPLPLFLPTDTLLFPLIGSFPVVRRNALVSWMSCRWIPHLLPSERLSPKKIWPSVLASPEIDFLFSNFSGYNVALWAFYRCSTGDAVYTHLSPNFPYPPSLIPSRNFQTPPFSARVFHTPLQVIASLPWSLTSRSRSTLPCFFVH